MMKNESVSIMIPCYNGAPFLKRLFACLLAQTIDGYHIIIADDGSTDESAEIIEEYRHIFVQRGIRITYLYQENKGLAGAINLALKRVDTEYCTWMDVDDRIDSEHLAKMEAYLKKNRQEKWVMCKGSTYNEDALDLPVGTLGECFVSEGYAEALLTHKVNCTPGLYMVRTDALIEALGGKRHIYDDNRRMGQNMQLLCPMALKYGRPGRIDEYLFFYTIRNNSLSHCIGGVIKKEMDYVRHIQDIKYNTIKQCGFITKKYKAHILYKMKAFEKYWKIQMLQCHEINEEVIETFLQVVDVHKYKKMIGARMVVIWGYYEIGRWWKRVLQSIDGEIKCCYVDSDINKVDNIGVISTGKLNPEKHFVIVPLRWHQDVWDSLREKKFSKSDCIYMEEIINRKFRGKND